MIYDAWLLPRVILLVIVSSLNIKNTTETQLKFFNGLWDIMLFSAHLILSFKTLSFKTKVFKFLDLKFYFKGFFEQISGSVTLVFVTSVSVLFWAVSNEVFFIIFTVWKQVVNLNNHLTMSWCFFENYRIG